MKVVKFLIVAASAATLAACATTYDKAGLAGGYIQRQLEPGVWRVAFGGNGYTTRESVQTYWLYRCAELTLQQGYDGFRIISPVQLTSLQQQPKDESRGLIKVHGAVTYTYVPMVIEQAPKPALEADIQLLKGPVTANPPQVFDARRLKAALEPYVTGTKCNNNVCPHVHRYIMPSEPS